MEIKKTRVNQVFYDKTTDGYVIVTAVENGVATAVEAIKDPVTGYTPVDGGKTITITNNDDICYRLEEDPNPPRVVTFQDFAIDDGVLLFEGEAVKMGEIRVKKLLATSRKSIIFIGSFRDEEAVFAYSTKTGTFDKLETLSEYVVKQEDDNVVVLDNKYTMKTIEVDGVETEKKVYIGAMAVIVTPSKYILGYTDGVVFDENSTVQIIGHKTYVGTGIAVNNEGEAVADGYRYKVFGSYVGTIETGEPAKLSRCYVYDRVIYITSKEIIYSNSQRYKVNTSKLGDATILVDVTVDGNITTLVFSNPDKRNVKKVVYEVTDDRGVDYTIS